MSILSFHPVKLVCHIFYIKQVSHLNCIHPMSSCLGEKRDSFGWGSAAMVWRDGGGAGVDVGSRGDGWGRVCAGGGVCPGGLLCQRQRGYHRVVQGLRC